MDFVVGCQSRRGLLKGSSDGSDGLGRGALLVVGLLHT